MKKNYRKLQNLACQCLKHPVLLGKHQLAFTKELIKAVVGRSDVAPAKGDKRFRDGSWNKNPVYRVLKQGYLTLVQEIDAWIGDLDLDRTEAEQLRFVTGQITDALAPTNILLGNPEAVKRIIETGGGSMVKGLKNLLRDIIENRGMPTQVDKDAFKLGENIACSPGAVVFRNEMLEVIRYKPTTKTVHEKPLILIPPHTNKYYIFDISPDKSLIEFQVANGFQVFAVSWRDPKDEHSRWGLEDYMQALEQAIDAACRITGSNNANIVGACTGGLTITVLVAHLAMRGDKKVNSLTLMSSMLDMTGFRDTAFGMFANRAFLEKAKRAAEKGKKLEGRTMARLFAMLRPNYLIWEFWVNNYLLGEDPPAFDLLYWSNDFSGMPARLHSEFLDVAISNPLVTSGKLTVRGTVIDLKKVTCDVFCVSGTTDHITPWHGCYRSASLFGGELKFILSVSGHVQSILSPPGNPKARYYINDRLPEDSEAFLEGATEYTGSWWEQWADWLAARSGDKKPASKFLGSRKHPAKEAAPGTYVYNV